MATALCSDVLLKKVKSQGVFPSKPSFICAYFSGNCSCTIILFSKQRGKNKTTSQTSVKIKPILVVSVRKITDSPVWSNRTRFNFR